MATAVNQSVQHPQQALDGLHAALARLAQVGVEVCYTHKPNAAISRYDERSHILTIRADACFEDQVWALSQAWLHVAIGPWASLAHAVPALRLVPIPTQREPLPDAPLPDAV